CDAARREGATGADQRSGGRLMSERASIFDNSLDDLSAFTTKPKSDQPQTPPEAVRAVAEKVQFRSREPIAVTAPKNDRAREDRRVYRPGRNCQLNIKVSAETEAAFYALADQQGWVLGETLERAVAALQKELAAK